MNRDELKQRLRALPFGAADWWLTAGGAMVLYGFREESADIDLGCSSALADRLEAEGRPCRRLPDGSRQFRYETDVELFENWLYDRVVTVEGFPVLSVAGLLELKERLGREKDLRDIALIRAAADPDKKQEE